MAEYIEREKVLDEINKQRRFYLHERDGETDIEKLYLLWGSDNALTTMEDIMSDILPADVAPVVHGRWKENDNFDDGFWVCSSCGFVSEATAAHKLYKFCPNCGADMREE